MPRTARLLYPVLAAVLQVGCALVNAAPPAPSPADSAEARQVLNTSLLRYWRSVLPQRPDLAVALGRRVDLLPSPVDAIDDRRPVTLARRLGVELDDIDPGALSPRDYATLQTFRWELDATAEGSAFGALDFSLISPRYTPLRHVVRVLEDHPFNASGDLDRYLFLLDALGFWIADVRVALEVRAERGIVASGDAVRSFRALLVHLRNLAARGAWHVATARLTNVDTALVRDFRAQEHESLTLRLEPSFDSLITWLDGYATRARPRPGLWQYPGGKEYFRYLLRRSLGVEIEPEEAHRAGLSDLRRMDSLMAVVRARAGWQGTVQAFHDSLLRMPGHTTISADSAAGRVRATVVRIRDTLRTRVATLPAELPLIRVATPLEAAFNPEGLVRPSEYADSASQLVVTPFWGSPVALAEGGSLLFRWGWPGAALAATLSYAGDSLSPMVLLHPSPATQAGWAEYAASMAGELGFYADPFEAYGRLLHEAWNAALLVADTGLHYFGWGRQQAVAVLRPYSLASDAALDSMFVDLLVQGPGRAGGAAIGAREHAAMRAWMQRTLGSSFQPRAWHSEVLSLGPVPLPVLASYLEWWGWNERKNALDAARRARSPGR